MSSNLFGSIIKKDINNKYENNFFSYQFFNCIVSFFSAIFLLILSDNLNVSKYTVFLAVAFGIITLIQQITNLMAIEKGPFSYTSVIISLSSLIPTLSGAIWWDEEISPVQYVGIALLVVSLIFSVDLRSKDKKSDLSWFFYCIIAFICTGLIGVMQKLHQTSQYKNELDAFLIIAFSISFLSSLILFVFSRNRRNSVVYTEKKSIINIKPVLLLILSGLFVALNNKLNLYLSGVLDSVIFFPIVNGGGLILTTFAAIIIYKEKLNKFQMFGLLSGIISVILLCLS